MLLRTPVNVTQYFRSGQVGEWGGVTQAEAEGRLGSS